ncbi:hypothetical protein F4780DRAFT_762648 [Xylariomycetidae sp. FL0641]|nr:hypothetical protein F4780DRAFT_762648 [Xylariomycetidae sp. FL0641]
MWIFENEGAGLEGKRLWLRPGKRYLFGRTAADPGQLAIRGPGSEKISRKHVTIQVDPVNEGDAENMSSRSKVTIEDLGSKGGTKVNDQKYKGESCTLNQDTNILQMGIFPFKFRITWFPVVLSFSYTKNQLRSNPLERLRQDLEQLDVKLLTDYDVALTTHVVSKKRNTSKGLQALINGRYIVNDEFVDAIVTATTPPPSDDGAASSPLEEDFDGNWPDELQFLPAAGEEAAPRPTEAFAPNPARAEMFDGYTFIFYNKAQYESLLAPITNGRGKALLNEVEAGVTQIDDFIRYVKGVAGEKGLGEFEDGSEGRGVVVVKWMPSTSENEDWFADFFRSISLRLDHRLIDQKDFLGAILSNDASCLRRPLEFESQPGNSDPAPTPSGTTQQPMDVAQGEPPMDVDQGERTVPTPPKRPAPPRRGREPVRSRFSGFGVSHDSDSDSDDNAEQASISVAPDPTSAIAESSQEGLFVSQDVREPEPEATAHAGRSQRKRPMPPLPEPEDVMNGIAPAAAQFKRRRIAAGEDLSRSRARETTTASAEATPDAQEAEPTKAKAKPKQEFDVLDLARRNREEAEKRAKEEREELEAAPEDLDLAQIRRLHIVDEMPLRSAPPTRTREQDVADGRWDPSWNGRKNFKKFRQRGAPQGRQADRIIVQLEEVKSKGFGIGDDYWLEDTSQSQQQRRQKGSQTSQSQSQIEAARKKKEEEMKRVEQHLEPLDSSESEGMDEDQDGEEEEEEEEDVLPSTARTRSSRATPTTQSQAARTRSSRATPATQSQAARTTQGTTQRTGSARTAKRPAAAPPPAKPQPAKRPKGITIGASDDSDDDELRFRFGKR